MNVLNLFDKIDDIIYEPIKLMTDWAREPLKERENRRQMARDQYSAHVETEEKIKQASHAANLDMAQKKLDADLEIKRKTDVQRILVEIEELRKDKDLIRMKAVSDAIMQYQEHLTRLNVSAINAIGCMQLDLREKAQNLVYEKTIKYKELQDNAHSQAVSEIMKIETDFAGNEPAKMILYKSVDVRLANIISTAQNFLLELNNDITVLNRSINLLTERGQTFIQDHLSQFHLVTNGSFLESPEAPKTLPNGRGTP